MPFKMREEFWTSVLAMVFAELRESRWRDQILRISIQTRSAKCQLGDLLPFSLDTNVWMCTDWHPALEERAVGPQKSSTSAPPECKGQPDLWVEDAENVLLVENKTTANARPQQEDQYSRCLKSARAFAGKKKALFYAIPRTYLGPGNLLEQRFLAAGGDADVTRGLLLWDETLKGTVRDVLGLSEWFLQGFPS